jgi:hypothetical protein
VVVDTSNPLSLAVVDSSDQFTFPNDDDPIPFTHAIYWPEVTPKKKKKRDILNYQHFVFLTVFFFFLSFAQENNLIFVAGQSSFVTYVVFDLDTLEGKKTKQTDYKKRKEKKFLK